MRESDAAHDVGGARVGAQSVVGGHGVDEREHEGVALDESGGELGESRWHALRLADAAPAPRHESLFDGG